eukprot:CAMPEP_0172207764 /NCGR_PEP_ID=MMETSP1050-20130122/34037_1 /TAXON_ID=233186 /ORGANISM="Cryptomonas curvata, Strain CCAP979/52" /LENGTH=227 /DNA_ID=CAMNT_0012887159 /DNA_START=486 /DNA_END=1165 /DNA_ORIENTATION=+
MSSACSASIASTVAFGGYLDRVYEQNMKEAEQAYAAHLQAAKELHQAQVHMMRSKRAIRALNDDDLSQATAVATAATELFDRKRKAAVSAEEDFNATARLTRHCYATEDYATEDTRSPVYHAVYPVYSTVNSGDDTPGYCPFDPMARSDCPSSPSYCPVSKDYSPQNPCGNGDSPQYNSPIAYCPITGVPTYRRRAAYVPTSPSYTPTSPAYSSHTPDHSPPSSPTP